MNYYVESSPEFSAQHQQRTVSRGLSCPAPARPKPVLRHCARPSGFGMLLKESVGCNAKNTDCTNSNASFIRVPNLLLVFGAGGALQPGMPLELDGEKLLAAAKERRRLCL
jgi:hypothetical protein